MRKTILLAAAALAATAAVAQPRPWHLTPDGYGPVRIGMTRAQVERALNVRLEGEPVDDANVCIEMSAERGRIATSIFMFLDRRLSRIAADRRQPGHHPARHRHRRHRRPGPPRLWPRPAGRGACLYRPPGRISDLLDPAEPARRPLRHRR